MTNIERLAYQRGWEECREAAAKHYQTWGNNFMRELALLVPPAATAPHANDMQASKLFELDADADYKHPGSGRLLKASPVLPTVPKSAPPRYDDVYAAGVAAMDEAAPPGEGSPLDAWRDWFKVAGAGWEDIECIECELGRPCLKVPPCEDAERAEGPCPSCRSGEGSGR